MNIQTNLPYQNPLILDLVHAMIIESESEWFWVIWRKRSERKQSRPILWNYPSIWAKIGITDFLNMNQSEVLYDKTEKVNTNLP
jgi:hypothetical protein